MVSCTFPTSKASNHKKRAPASPFASPCPITRGRRVGHSPWATLRDKKALLGRRRRPLLLRRARGGGRGRRGLGRARLRLALDLLDLHI